MSLAVIWLAGSAAALAPTPVIAPDSSAVAPQQVRATRLVRPIVIDGVLHDGMWEGAERVTGFLQREDRKSTRLNSSHTVISYAVFCLKKKKQNKIVQRIPLA